MLGLRLVDRDDREAEGAVGGHRAEADHAGRRLLGAGQDLLDLVRSIAVEQRHQVAAVVHGQLRAGVGDRVEVRVVGVPVLAATGEHADPVLGDERGGHVVLGRERVAGGQDHVGAAGLERPHQVGRLGGHVQAGADAEAGERSLALEPLADQAQDRHLPLRPFDPADALGCEARDP